MVEEDQSRGNRELHDDQEQVLDRPSLLNAGCLNLAIESRKIGVRFCTE